MNKVICVGSSQTKTIACGYSEIIDIQSVTIAFVKDRNQCTETYMIPVIESIQPPCKRSLKDLRHVDGSEVYRRYLKLCLHLSTLSPSPCPYRHKLVFHDMHFCQII